MPDSQESKIRRRIGFMQGRLSPQIDGKIQAFPWGHWQSEFAAAKNLGLSLMEWTLDQDRLYENPLMTTDGQVEILKLKTATGVNIASLTGDCFMQAPFYKVAGAQRSELLKNLHDIIASCAKVGIKFILIPLVDNGRLENSSQEEVLISGLKTCETLLTQGTQKIVFESDFEPLRLREFIARFDPRFYGINYDIGNSAALGFDADEEFEAYRNRIDNIHVKDRVLGGTTVPLGTGNADFAKVFRNVAACGYAGNFILQTARATDGNHAETLARYRELVRSFLETAA